MECVDPSAADSLQTKEAEKRSSVRTHTLSSSSSDNDSDDGVEEMNGSPSGSVPSLAQSPQSNSEEEGVGDKNGCVPSGHLPVKSLSSPSSNAFTHT